MNKIKGIMNLPQKVEIKKSPVDVEGAEKAAERLHAPPKVVVEKVRKRMEKTVRKPKALPADITETMASPTPPATRAKKSAEPAAPTADALREEPTTRITLDLPASLYKGAKIKSFTEMMTLRNYIIDLLRADLNI